MPDATPKKFRNMGELTSYLATLEQRVAKLERENARLNDALSKTQRQVLAAPVFRTRDPLPNTLLLSDSFIMRAFAVWGHYVTAQMIISIPIMIIAFMLMFSLIGNLR